MPISFSYTPIRVSLAILIVFVALTALPGAAAAQAPTGSCVWSEPVNLSDSPDSNTTFGQIIGDPFGRVHAFWAEISTEETQSGTDNYVAYRVWDGAAWSPASDVLAASAGYTVLYDVAISRPGDRIYLLWRNGGNFIISSAPLFGAADPHLWRSTSIAFGSEASGFARMAVAADDSIHVVSISDNQIVKHSASSDGGLSWSSPDIIWYLSNSDRAMDYPALLIDSKGTYHAAWQENLGAKEKWAAYAIGYAQSTDGGKTWTKPIEWESIPRGYANPTLFEDSQGTLHLFWNGASGTLDGRYYAWSEDSGNSWSEVQQLTGGYYRGGRSGPPRIVEDSAETLHVVHSIELESAGGDTRVVTSYLEGHTWSPPAMVDVQHEGDMPALAVSSGNRLHVLLWTQAEPAEILYSTCELQTPRLTPLPTPELISATAVAPSAEQAVINIPAVPTGTPAVDTAPRGGEFDDVQSAQTGSSAFPLLVGSIASGAFIIAAVVFTLGRRQKANR